MVNLFGLCGSITVFSLESAFPAGPKYMVHGVNKWHYVTHKRHCESVRHYRIVRMADGKPGNLPLVVEAQSPVHSSARQVCNDPAIPGSGATVTNVWEHSHQAAIICCSCESCTNWSDEICDLIKSNLRMQDGTVPKVWLYQENLGAYISWTEKWEDAMQNSLCKLVLFSDHGFQKDEAFRQVCDLAILQRATVVMFPNREIREQHLGYKMICNKDYLSWKDDTVLEKLAILLDCQVSHGETSLDEVTVDVNKEMEKLKIHEEVIVPAARCSEPKGFFKEFSEFDFLGKGCFGEVYRARHKHDGRLYAIKMIRDTQSSNKKPATAEVEILARLAHESIVRYYTSWVGPYPPPHLKPDTEKQENRRLALYIKMEYCENGSLQKLLAKKPRQLKYSPMQMFEQIMCGVSYIHSHNITHGDIKTDNIFVGDNYQLKLGDFGLSKIHKMATTASDADDRNSESDLRSWSKMEDIISLGNILHELVTDYRDKVNPDIQDDEQRRKDLIDLVEGRHTQVSQPKCPQLKEVISQLLRQNPPKIKDISSKLIQKIKLCCCEFCMEGKNQQRQTENTTLQKQVGNGHSLESTENDNGKMKDTIQKVSLDEKTENQVNEERGTSESSEDDFLDALQEQH